MSGGKLSERFAQLKNSAPTGTRNVRVEKSTQNQKNNRAAATAARRGMAAPAAGKGPRRNSNATAKSNNKTGTGIALIQLSSDLFV
jgi:hypothetical protein